MANIHVKKINIRIRGGEQLTNHLMWHNFGNKLLRQIAQQCRQQGITGNQQLEHLNIQSEKVQHDAHGDNWQLPLVNRLTSQLTRQLSDKQRGG